MNGASWGLVSVTTRAICTPTKEPGDASAESAHRKVVRPRGGSDPSGSDYYLKPRLSRGFFHLCNPRLRKHLVRAVLKTPGGSPQAGPPLDGRKATLEMILAKCGPGIRFNEHMQGDGETMFRHACKMGLEGIVSKRKDSPYCSGRSPDWLKIRTRTRPP
jgi:hypothetical protein